MKALKTVIIMIYCLKFFHPESSSGNEDENDSRKSVDDGNDVEGNESNDCSGTVAIRCLTKNILVPNTQKLLFIKHRKLI